MKRRRTTRRFVLAAVLALVIGVMLVPTAQAEPFQQMLDCHAAHQLGYMAGADCSGAATLVSVPTISEAPPVPTSGGFDFADAGVGAAVAVGGIIILGLLAVGALVLRRHQRPVGA